jgi:hypothetical protein
MYLGFHGIPQHGFKRFAFYSAMLIMCERLFRERLAREADEASDVEEVG